MSISSFFLQIFHLFFFGLNSMFLKVLLKYEGNISFAAVHGLPATGKSTFLNKLLLS